MRTNSFLISLLVAAVALGALATFAHAQDTFVYFLSPLAAGDDDGTYLLLERRELFNDSKSFILLYRNAGKEASEPVQYHGAYRAAAVHEGFLYVFHGKSYSLYRNTQHVVSRAWPFQEWEPCAAAQSDKRLYVLASQAMQLTVVSLAEGKWTQGLLSPPAAGQIQEVHAAPIVNGFLATVSVPGANGRIIQSISFNGRRWGSWETVAQLPPGGEFVMTSDGTTARVLLRDRRTRLTARTPLRERLWLQTSGWTEERDTGLRESLLSTSYRTAACYSEARPRVFLLSPYSGEVFEAVCDATNTWSARDRFAVVPSLFGMSLLVLSANLAVTFGLVVAVAVSLAMRHLRSDVDQISGQEVRLASWRRRTLAALIDIFVVYAGVDLSVTLATGSRDPGAISTIFTFAYVFYHMVLETIIGQTLGKALMDIAVVNSSGQRPSALSVLVRSLLRVIEVVALPLLGLVVLLNTRHQQRLGDLLGRTFVIVPPRQPSHTRPEWDIDDFQ